MRAKLEAMGPVNMMALEEYKETAERHSFLETQRKDLISSIENTTATIKEIDQISRQKFEEAFAKINENFQATFKKLFGGGHAFMKLTDEENSAESGIDVVASPPGKRLQSVLLLSGGEKALTALALLVGIFQYAPSPFCILDEVDAPLDEANVGRFTELVKEMSVQTQFVLITHSKKTMSIAPVLYGVTMQEPGVSKLVSVRFGAAVEPRNSACRGRNAALRPVTFHVIHSHPQLFHKACPRTNALSGVLSSDFAFLSIFFRSRKTLRHAAKRDENR